MQMQNFELEKCLDDWTLDAETLAGAFGVKAYNAGHVTVVATAPRCIRFGDGQFSAEFNYIDGQISSIVLKPRIDNVENPGYSNKEYEAAKFEYCSGILRQLFGNKIKATEDGIRYTSDKYMIGSYVIKEGRNKYDGGDIVISVR